MYQTAAVLALAVLAYSLVSGRMDRLIVGGAISFTLIGLLLGEDGFGILVLSDGSSGIGILAEITLALVLFTDAANADLKELTRSSLLPKRMLLIGLPLTILLGFAFGTVILGGLALIEIALLATVLAPTDAALGKAVITDEQVPNRLRTTLNVESGLNDGICVPIFLVILAFATDSVGSRTIGEITFALLLEELGIGAVTGIFIAVCGAGLSRVAHSQGWISEVWLQVPVPAIALACFMSAQALGGSGFIAAFVGGLVFGSMIQEQKHKLLLEAESVGEVFGMLTWIVFGATVVSQVFAILNIEILIYALLSLTIIRMLPIWLSLRGTGLNHEEALFLGWFGPRGLASIVLTIMVLEAELPGGEKIASVVACTILLSVLAHGLSAQRAARWIATRTSSGEQNISKPTPNNDGNIS